MISSASVFDTACFTGEGAPSTTSLASLTTFLVAFFTSATSFLTAFAFALATLIAVLRSGRKDLRPLAAGQILGILGQGVLGGITVLTNLNPITELSVFAVVMVVKAGFVHL